MVKSSGNNSVLGAIIFEDLYSAMQSNLPPLMTGPQKDDELSDDESEMEGHSRNARENSEEEREDEEDARRLESSKQTFSLPKPTLFDILKQFNIIPGLSESVSKASSAASSSVSNLVKPIPLDQIKPQQPSQQQPTEEQCRQAVMRWLKVDENSKSVLNQYNIDTKLNMKFVELEEQLK